MKIRTIIKAGLFAVALPIAFTSCKKDHTCTCKYTDALGNEKTDTRTLENQTRADAVENCENFERSYSFANVNCNL